MFLGIWRWKAQWWSYINWKQSTNICKWQLIFNIDDFLTKDSRLASPHCESQSNMALITTDSCSMMFMLQGKHIGQPHISDFRRESDIVHVGVPLTKTQALICIYLRWVWVACSWYFHIHKTYVYVNTMRSEWFVECKQWSSMMEKFMEFNLSICLKQKASGGNGR